MWLGRIDEVRKVNSWFALQLQNKKKWCYNEWILYLIINMSVKKFALLQIPQPSSQIIEECEVRMNLPILHSLPHSNQKCSRTKFIKHYTIVTSLQRENSSETMLE